MTWTPVQIKELRTRLGMTRAEFGDACGVGYEMVVSWEQPADSKRHREPTATACKLFDCLSKISRK